MMTKMFSFKRRKLLRRSQKRSRRSLLNRRRSIEVRQSVSSRPLLLPLNLRLKTQKTNKSKVKK